MIDSIKTELGGLYGDRLLEDMGEIISLYDFYDGAGQRWQEEEGLDYTPCHMITNHCKRLIKREARFMFGRTPEIRVRDRGTGQVIEPLQAVLDRVLENSSFSDRLVKGARDCFIGKRVALKISGGLGEDTVVSVKPSPEFVYDTFDDDSDKLKKIIFFYTVHDSAKKDKQRIWKQKYEMGGGRCYMTEGIYDGCGQLIEGGETRNTGLSFIPCRVIINDGLTGDMLGESDVKEIMEGQRIYNRLKSDDIDALRFNMFPQRVAVDASGESLENMRIAPGALVDLVTEPARGDEGVQAKLEMLESGFSYDARFEHAINRVKADMHELLGVPDLSLEQLKGLSQSGKSMKVLYWELIERSEERWAVWGPALKWLARSIIELERVYGDERLPDYNYYIDIEHLYPLIEDEESERELDLKEVDAGVRSVSDYAEKWNIGTPPRG